MLQFAADFIERVRELLGVQVFTTLATYFCTDFHGSSIATTTENFFHQVGSQFTTAHGALVESSHRLILSFHSIQRLGSGR